MPVPNIFGTATSAIPLSQLDTNFATPVTIGNTAVQLGNTVTSFGNVTLTNVTISSGNVIVTGANVSGTANVSTLVVTGNQTSLGNVAITGNISANIATFGAGSNTAPSITTTGDTNTGIFFPAADTIAFSEGGVESMRIDSSGNVGIGTSSPLAGVKLDTFGGYFRLRSNTTINADISGNVNALVFESSGGTGEHAIIAGGNASTNFLTFYTANATTPTERMRIDSSGNVGIGTSSPSSRLDVRTSAAEIARFSSSATNGGYQIFYPDNVTTPVYVGSLKAILSTGNATDFAIVGTGANNMVFGTNSAERARIDSSGNLLVGTTSDALTGSQVGTASKFAVSGSVGRVQIADTGNDIAFSRNSSNYISATAGTSANITVKAGSAAGGVQLTNGATSWASASDERTKTDLVEITDATAKVATLRAVTGRYKTDEEGVSRAFLIAQDVQAVLPEAVTVIQNADNDEDNGKLMLSYTETIPLLVAAIKEQQAIITQLQADVAALKGTA